LSLYEVFKRILQQRGEDQALQAVAQMQQGHVVEEEDSKAMGGESQRRWWHSVQRGARWLRV
jgi:hypothetical protein